MTILDLTSFTKALASLQKAYNARRQDVKNEFLLDACIQRFEYTYELSHKMLKRYLEISEPASNVIDEMSFPDLIRTGYERGLLLHSWNSWRDYREARNLTSHTYDEEKALKVWDIIDNFLKDSDHLLKKLMEHNA